MSQYPLWARGTMPLTRCGTRRQVGICMSLHSTVALARNVLGAFILPIFKYVVSTVDAVLFATVLHRRLTSTLVTWHTIDIVREVQFVSCSQQ